MDPSDVLENRSSTEFQTALFNSLKEGAKESLVDFIPSLCHTAYGLGRTLWATAEHPIESAQDFSNACYEAAECIVDY